MIAQLLRRLAVTGLALAALTVPATGSALAASDPAQDKVLGPMAIEPVEGNLESNIVFTTAGGCPKGSNSVTRIYGPSLPTDGQNVIGNTGLWGFGSPPADRMIAPMTITLQEVIERQDKPITLDGEYHVRMQCQLEFPDTILENFGVFEGFLEIHDKKYTARTTAEDLPETPTPKTGADALAGYEASKRVPPPPLIDQQGDLLAQEIAKQNAAKAAEKAARSGAGSTGLALGVAGGVVLIGLLPLVGLRRQSRPVGRR